MKFIKIIDSFTNTKMRYFAEKRKITNIWLKESTNLKISMTSLPKSKGKLKEQKLKKIYNNKLKKMLKKKAIKIKWDKLNKNKQFIWNEL